MKQFSVDYSGKRDACTEHFHIAVPVVPQGNYLIFGTRMSLMKTRVTSTVGQCIFQPLYLPSPAELGCAGSLPETAFNPVNEGIVSAWMSA